MLGTIIYWITTWFE